MTYNYDENQINLTGEVKLEYELCGEISFSNSGDSVPEYDGPYEAIPKISDQTLETAGRKMTKDIVIKAIPVQETTNNANGKTVHIG